MKTRFYLVLTFLCLVPGWISEASPPVVSGIRAAQRAGTHLMDIYHNVTASRPCTVYVAVSDNAGASYNVPVSTLTGSVGPGVTPGNDRHVVWNAETDRVGQFSSQCKVKITADDGTAPPVPAGMAYIPAGPFEMGDSFLEGAIAERPVHTVHVRAFFMDKNLVSRELWLPLYAWALGHGYSFKTTASSRMPIIRFRPSVGISWYDAVKWCNARSEKEGLTPCYYTDASQGTVYRSGNSDLANNSVKWEANGYRLPTEAEWEKAARGGQNGKRFPWGDTISHSQANYYSTARLAYDISPTRGFHPTHGQGTSPVGSFAPNGYGLYDMAGNLFEWSWDAYSDTWYGQLGATADDSRGPAFVGVRVLRGGYWLFNAVNLRCASRDLSAPTYASVNFGFRCVRGL